MLNFRRFEAFRVYRHSQPIAAPLSRAGGATGASLQLRRATNQTVRRGGAPQSPLEESATTSARWVRNDQLPLQLSLQVPVFERLFFSKLGAYVHRHVPKKAVKKQSHKQTDRQNRADLEQLDGCTTQFSEK